MRLLAILFCEMCILRDRRPELGDPANYQPIDSTSATNLRTKIALREMSAQACHLSNSCRRQTHSMRLRSTLLSARAHYARRPPELPPAEALRLLEKEFGHSSSSDPDAKTPANTSYNPSSTPSPTNYFASDDDDLELKLNLAGSAGAASVVLDSTASKYGPAVIALLAVNLFTGLALLVFSIMGWIHRGSSKSRSTIP